MEFLTVAVWIWCFFDSKYIGVSKGFIGVEFFLDSTDTKSVIEDIFIGVHNEIITMHYNPIQAIMFYNIRNEINGIYAICFVCSNLKIGIRGVNPLSYYPIKIKAHLKKYEVQLN